MAGRRRSSRFKTPIQSEEENEDNSPSPRPRRSTRNRPSGDDVAAGKPSKPKAKAKGPPGLTKEEETLRRQLEKRHKDAAAATKKKEDAGTSIPHVLLHSQYNPSIIQRYANGQKLSETRKKRRMMLLNQTLHPVRSAPRSLMLLLILTKKSLPPALAIPAV